MNERLIPEEILKSSKKMLFITHLALGDFTYLQPYFKKLKECYPDLVIDLWVDEVRRTYFFWRWKYLRHYILYDWVASCSFFNKIYTKTYSWGLFKKSLKEAQEESYPLVVSLATLRSRKYASWARKISRRGFVAGIKSKRGHIYKALDALIDYELSEKPKEGWHITELYSHQFKALFGIELSEQEKIPSIEIPHHWKGYGKKLFAEWGISTDAQVLFLNFFAKDKKRSWDSKKIPMLLDALMSDRLYARAAFILNAPPDHEKELRAVLSGRAYKNVFLLQASENFFQLPSVLSLCSAIVSVETSIMHFAVALNKPLLALMRTKSPEWIPLGHDKKNILFTTDRIDWISSIEPLAVYRSIKENLL